MEEEKASNTTATNEECCKDNCCSENYKKYKHGNANGGGAIYGLGFIGAAIYFIGHAATFGLGILGFLKAIVWPAFVIYKLLEFFHL